MTKKQRTLAKELQHQVANWIGKRTIKGSQKDYYTVYKDFKNGNYEATYQTKLYNKHGGEYCTLLEVLAAGK